ncbi:unnamed protein product [Diabrotica balteata]|uniref:Mannosyl-oligosaccharide glucosidase n=1 Tax=Diabrotica balteata TaxID=107213 RepID=A0A9N9T664_DIABA|nr:unnamed protein product [Diabrotica balteata]
MVRQRERRSQANSDSNKADKGTNSSSSNGSSTSTSKSSESVNLFHYWKQFVVILVLSVAVCFGYMGYLETRINTPFDDRKVVSHSGLDVPDLFWGSYRPGAYFGLKTRDPTSLVTGLMWYFPLRLKPGGDGIRHWCEQGDNLEKYGWLQHDGYNFGIQEIIDGPFNITTSFVKKPGGNHGGEWSARVEVNYKKNNPNVSKEEVSLLWYVALDEETKGSIQPTNLATKITGIRGKTATLGDFRIKLVNTSGVLSHESFLSTTAPGLHLLKETVISSLRLAQDNPKSPRKIVLGGQLQAFNGDQKIDPNLVAIQLTGKVPFTIDISYESGFNTQESLNGNAYTEVLETYRRKFLEKFEKTFKLKQKGYQPREIKFAQAALSNMIGGIGYFYGSSRVQSDYIKEPVYYWRAPLYTAVPSRSFFPRGFLWDEGFHGFLISKWSLDMELDIMSHWFDLMNVEGWIPREQILGIEALAKVPSEFVVQKNTNANPPTFFLTLESILDIYDNELNGERFKLLERLYPRLQAWFAWFNTTQKGTIPGSYRWRGRDATSKRELNPKTLTSGLDDYPRASHPTDDERHIDLYCWMAIAAKTMARLAKLLGNDGYKYEQTAKYLLNNELMDRLHWSDHAEVYADYGLHTDAVKLQKPKPLTRNQNQNLEMQRVVMKKPEYRLVDSTYGYVSLFPFMLQVLDPKSPKLEKTLEVLIPRLLTPYGLQSLSKDSPLYGKRNTEHDPPYWRGQIWIPINYLATKALHHYSKVNGPYQELAKEKYETLRSALIKNVIDQYYKTGYIWEHYNEKTGEGGGARPFNGWSALVVLLLGEEY